MIDKYLKTPLEKLLHPLVIAVAKTNIHPNMVTVVGFIIGVLGMGLITQNLYTEGLIAIIINRILDGLDGHLARHTQRTSDAGGFLDTVLDFIFYSGVVVAFGISAEHNLLPALILVFSFVGTCSSFQSFATLAQKHNIKSDTYPNKALYYMGGITEGTETIVVFVLFCLFPNYFGIIAYTFALLCAITTLTRIIQGYIMLRNAKNNG